MPELIREIVLAWISVVWKLGEQRRRQKFRIQVKKNHANAKKRRIVTLHYTKCTMRRLFDIPVDQEFIEDITCPLLDMNFIFECSTQYLTRSLCSLMRYRVEHEKIKFISTSGHVIFCLLYKHQWKKRDLLRNHNDGDLFTCEDDVLFSRVKIWSFRAKVHSVFHWCLYNKNLYVGS